MKKTLTRVISFLLCILFAVCVPGCTSNGPEETTQKTQTTTAPFNDEGIRLTTTRIIMQASLSDEVRSTAKNLATTAELLGGTALTIGDDDLTEKEEGTVEILIGKTNRSSDLLTELPDVGFAIRRSGSQIFIQATSNSILQDAIEYFLQNEVRHGQLDGDMLYCEDGYSYVESYSALPLSGKTYYLVYSASLDDQVEATGYKNNGLDYDYAQAKALAEILTAKGVTVSLKKDSEATTDNEILFGTVDRPECTTFLSSIDATQYGYGIVDGKLVVGGHSSASNALAVELLKKAISLVSITKITAGKASVRSNGDWYLGLPSYPGGVLSDVAEGGYDQLVYLIRKTDLSQFETFCETLTDLGYTKTYENQIENNVFRSYDGKKGRIYLYHTPNDKMTRIITGMISKVNNPSDITTDDPKVTEITLTQMQLDFTTGSGGMGYVITLEDGSFFLIDSGSGTGSTAASKGLENLDHVRLWNLLNTLNKRQDGKIIIRGWFMTHVHSDHFDVFFNFCKAYGSQVTIENYYECVVPLSEGYNAKNPEFHESDVQSAQKYVSGGFQLISLHAGQKIQLPGVTLETLYTAEDLYYQTIHYFNNASTCFRLTVQDNSEDGVYQALICGDIYSDACGVILKRYTAETLKSDVVQVAHHGYQGATKAFYTVVDPTVALWPTSQEIYESMISAAGSLNYQVIDRFLVNELHVAENYTASEYTVTITLPYTLGTAVKRNVSTSTK